MARSPDEAQYNYDMDQFQREASKMSHMAR